jgi:Fic family protein
LELFLHGDAITSRDIEALFGISRRTARYHLSAWAQSGFLIILDPAKKSRRYGLAEEFRKHLING